MAVDELLPAVGHMVGAPPLQVTTLANVKEGDVLPSNFDAHVWGIRESRAEIHACEVEGHWHRVDTIVQLPRND